MWKPLNQYFPKWDANFDHKVGCLNNLFCFLHHLWLEFCILDHTYGLNCYFSSKVYLIAKYKIRNDINSNLSRWGVVMTVKELNVRYASYQGDLEKEFIRISVKEDCWLDDFLIMDNTYNDKGGISNKYRHVYQFPLHKVWAGEVVYLYTKKGKNVVPDSDNKDRTLRFYWGLGRSIWNIDGDTVHLIKIDKIESKEIS